MRGSKKSMPTSLRLQESDTAHVHGMAKATGWSASRIMTALIRAGIAAMNSDTTTTAAIGRGMKHAAEIETERQVYENRVKEIRAGHRVPDTKPTRADKAKKGA